MSAPRPEVVEGRVTRVSGPVVHVDGLAHARLYDVVRVGAFELLGEVIRVERATSVVQLYESSRGLMVGDGASLAGTPLEVELGPGLLGTVFDGIQRPLHALADVAGGYTRPLLVRGLRAPALDRDRRWRFVPSVGPGDVVGEGDRLGSVAEGAIDHRVLVPPGRGGRVTAVFPGERRVLDAVAELDGRPVTLLSRWPVRTPRPFARRLDPATPMVTGQRVIDTLFPLARGGTATIPGGFGTGKTVTEQSLAKWADADIVIYIGCGERGNELTEVLTELPALEDPRTGRALMDRTILIANTSNMPVAAREASIYTGITLAEYYRDQGHHVAILADSTSRWAEALREVSGRLEEMPGEEGYPAYLISRLAQFYERAGLVVALGAEGRRGSATIIGAVSPPGGDFSEPVTQYSLRLAGTFWALDTDLARRRHFPAIHWTKSYSLYELDEAFERDVAPGWGEQRRWALALLQREEELLATVQLLGADALAAEERLILRTGRALREDFLQQSSFEDDAYCPLRKQFWMLWAHRALHDERSRLLGAGGDIETEAERRRDAALSRARDWPLDEAEERARALVTSASAEVEP
jgi:V/A-type H+/Na+-transporting ATPase subunit A